MCTVWANHTTVQKLWYSVYYTPFTSTGYTDKKENQNFPIYKEIQNGSVAKSYITNGLLIYGEIFPHFLIYWETLPHIWLCNCSTLNFLIYGDLGNKLIFFFISVLVDVPICQGLPLLSLWPSFSPYYPPISSLCRKKRIQYKCLEFPFFQRESCSLIKKRDPVFLRESNHLYGILNFIDFKAKFQH